MPDNTWTISHNYMKFKMIDYWPFLLLFSHISENFIDGSIINVKIMLQKITHYKISIYMYKIQNSVNKVLLSCSFPNNFF